MRRTGLGVLITSLLSVSLVMPAAAMTLGPTPRCGQAGSGVAVAAEPGLRVATFNVLHGLTDDGDRTLERRLAIQVPQLAASGADVLGLQEVGESPRHGRVIERLAAGLAAATSSRWYWQGAGSAPSRTSLVCPISGPAAATRYPSSWRSTTTATGDALVPRARLCSVAGPSSPPPRTGCPARMSPAGSSASACPHSIRCACLRCCSSRAAAVCGGVATPLGHVSVVATHTSAPPADTSNLARGGLDRSSATAAHVHPGALQLRLESARGAALAAAAGADRHVPSPARRPRGDIRSGHHGAGADSHHPHRLRVGARRLHAARPSRANGS